MKSEPAYVTAEMMYQPNSKRMGTGREAMGLIRRDSVQEPAVRQFDWERYGGTVSPSQYVAEVTNWRDVLPDQMQELGAEAWEIAAAIELCEAADRA